MKLRRKQIQKYLVRLLNEFRTRDALPLLVILGPILFLIVIDPASFTLVSFVGREIGRAGFIFLFFLVAWDFHDSREQFKATRSKWRHLLSLMLFIAVVAYYCYVDVFNIDSFRVYVTSQLGVSQKSTLSFFAAMDFIVFVTYCLATTAILYSPRRIPLMVTPVIYAIGSGILATMDAFFPEDSLAFLQIWVYVIWDVVIFLLSVIGYHTNVSPLSSLRPSLQLTGNRLFLCGQKGCRTLAIFWPSSGVVSMIVYSLVILVLMVKLDAPRKRKVLYAVVGAAGTYFVNVIRIILIVLYVTYIGLDVEAFHQSIGEVLFITWIFIYLLLVIRMENARYRQLERPRGMKQPARGRSGRVRPSR